MWCLNGQKEFFFKLFGVIISNKTKNKNIGVEINFFSKLNYS